MTVDMLIRAAAGVSALVIAASVVIPMLTKLRKPATQGAGTDAGILLVGPKPSASTATQDAHVVLDIAGRLRDAGNTDGVKLAHALIDALLAPPSPRA